MATPVPLPAPIFGLKDVSPKQANKRVSYKQALKQHKKLMTEATTITNNVAAKRLQSLEEANKLLDAGLPLYHERKAVLPGKYNNAAYHRSVKDLEALVPALEAKHIQLMNHVDALSRGKQTETRALADEANRVLFSLTSVRPWLEDHFEDRQAEKKIRQIERKPGQKLSRVHPDVAASFTVKREQAMTHLKDSPNVVSV